MSSPASPPAAPPASSGGVAPARRRRIAIAQIKHETNTFSPLPTTVASFGHGRGPAHDAEAAASLRGTNSPFAAFVEAAQAAGAEVLTPIAAEAWPSAPASRETFEALWAPVARALHDGCDALMLDLHGAMVVDGLPDAEGEILRRARALRPGLPIAVTLDYHTNLSQAMVENATVITGYKTYPHVDNHAVGMLAARVLLRALDGEIRPVMAWGRLPLLASILRHAPEDGPSGEIVAMARAAEAEGAAGRGPILAATWLPSFPHADTPVAGCGAVVVADGDPQAAQALAERILALAWTRRAEFVHVAPPLAASVAHAARLGEALDARRAQAADAPAAPATDRSAGVLAGDDPLGPVVLVDHCDNTGSGGTQDDMTVVAEILRQGLRDVAIAPIRDPAAVAAMVAAGVGARVRLWLGGRTDMPAIGARGQPIEVEGTVRAITDGEIVFRGPMYTGIRSHLGRSAVLDTGAVRIVVTELGHEPFDRVILTHAGIDPREPRFLMLKSRVHYRAGFRPIASAIVECAGRGVTSADLSQYPYRHIARPIYPLDPDTPRPARLAAPAGPTPE